MNLVKSKKRIAKKVKSGFHGYPKLSLAYFGETSSCANEVVVSFIIEEGSDVQVQSFLSDNDARSDETIQTTLVKIIERSNVKTVEEVAGVSVRK